MSDFIQIEVRKVCTSWKNQIRLTPPPKYKNLIHAMAQENDDSISETAAYILKDYFDRMPAHQRQKLLQKSKHHY
jgi:hypothetical protein